MWTSHKDLTIGPAKAQTSTTRSNGDRAARTRASCSGAMHGLSRSGVLPEAAALYQLRHLRRARLAARLRTCLRHVHIDSVIPVSGVLSVRAASSMYAVCAAHATCGLWGPVLAGRVG